MNINTVKAIVRVTIGGIGKIIMIALVLSWVAGTLFFAVCAYLIAVRDGDIVAGFMMASIAATLAAPAFIEAYDWACRD